MRIGLVIYGGLDTLSGGFLYDRVLVDHLRESGDQVEVVSLKWRSYACNLADNWSRRLREQLEGLPLDLMLQDELNHPSLFHLNPKLRRDYPIVSIVHHLRSSEDRAAWRNRLYRAVEKRYLNSVDGYVFNSHTTRGVVHSLVGDARPSVVAHPAGDRLSADMTLQEIEARAKVSGPLRVLFLGNVISRKQLHLLVDALARIPHDDWFLDVVGGLDVEPAYVQNVCNRIQEADVGDRVSFHGPLLDDDLAQRLRESHLLAVPSSYEGFGIVYLEGMSFGLPAIASTAGAAHEVIGHDRNGFLIAPGDAQALASHIAELAHDRSRLAKMGVAALRRYGEHPTWRDMAVKVREFLVTMVR